MSKDPDPKPINEDANNALFDGQMRQLERQMFEAKLLSRIASPLFWEPWCWLGMLLVIVPMMLEKEVTPVILFWLLVALLFAENSVVSKRRKAMLEWIEYQKTKDMSQG